MRMWLRNQIEALSVVRRVRRNVLETTCCLSLRWEYPLYANQRMQCRLIFIGRLVKLINNNLFFCSGMNLYGFFYALKWYRCIILSSFSSLYGHMQWLDPTWQVNRTLFTLILYMQKKYSRYTCPFLFLLFTSCHHL